LSYRTILKYHINGNKATESVNEVASILELTGGTQSIMIETKKVVFLISFILGRAIILWYMVFLNVSRLNVKFKAKEEKILYFIGKINKEIYKCISADIQTEDVIITDERIQHIKERHPNDYERYCEFMKDIVEQPDYIVETNKINTALILKEFEGEEGETFKTVLRLVTSTDNTNFKNSVITFMKINKKEWTRLLKNKRILYKRD